MFVFEGEEERGSGGFKDAIHANLGWFEGTKAILVSNNYWIDDVRPCLNVGMRGAINLDIAVSGPTFVDNL